MSVLGTGVAAGVAQTALQSQQVARSGDKRLRDTERAAERVREIIETRLKGLEEDDAAEDATRIRIDGQVPEHQHRDQQPPRQKHHADQAGQRQPATTSEDNPTAPVDDPASAAEAYRAADGGEGPLYRHLDVEA